MKLKKLAHMMILTCSIAALAACSSTKRSDSTTVADMSGDGAQSSAMSQGDQFAGQAGPAQSAEKRTFYFDYDKSEVRDEDKPAIIANANYLLSHPNAKIILEGHTDPRGSREYNVALGERRGNAVAEMLKSKGVSSSQIRIVSYGAERLASQDRTDEAYQLDRRAIIAYQ
jgi:peptidoglycan-associated lipoprotein